MPISIVNVLQNLFHNKIAYKIWKSEINFIEIFIDTDFSIFIIDKWVYPKTVKSFIRKSQLSVPKTEKTIFAFSGNFQSILILQNFVCQVIINYAFSLNFFITPFDLCWFVEVVCWLLLCNVPPLKSSKNLKLYLVELCKVKLGVTEHQKKNR